MAKLWTGIGSREAPDEIRDLQIKIGRVMTENGYTLLSGGANGSDTNFHLGVCEVDPEKAVIWLPWNNFNVEARPSNSLGHTFVAIDRDQFQTSREFFLNTEIISWFDNMKQAAQKFHARNYYQVVNDQYKGSSVVIYYAPEKNRAVKGGTRTAVETARHYGIPTYNLFIESEKEKLLELLGIEEK